MIERANCILVCFFYRNKNYFCSNFAEKTIFFDKLYVCKNKKIKKFMKSLTCNNYCVKIPFGVSIITKIFSSLPVSAFIYTKKSVSSTFPLNS